MAETVLVPRTTVPKKAEIYVGEGFYVLEKTLWHNVAGCSNNGDSVSVTLKGDKFEITIGLEGAINAYISKYLRCDGIGCRNPTYYDVAEPRKG